MSDSQVSSGVRVDAGPLVVGIDASHKRVGYCISRNLWIEAFGTWHIDANAPIRSRKDLWKELRDQIRNMERVYGTELRVVGIEAPYIGVNRQTALQHARTIGMMEAFAYTSFPYARIELIQPRSWRAALGLKGTGKQDPFDYATRELNTQHSDLSYREPSGWAHTLDQDAADAICIARSIYTLFPDE